MTRLPSFIRVVKPDLIRAQIKKKKTQSGSSIPLSIYPLCMGDYIFKLQLWPVAFMFKGNIKLDNRKIKLKEKIPSKK
jgi:hypothetical protein